MRRCHYPRPFDTREVLLWDRHGWGINQRRKSFQKGVQATIERLGLPDEYEEMRRSALYGRRPEPDERLLPALMGNLRMGGYIVRGNNGQWETVPLTSRQLHCLRLLAEGHDYSHIGAELGIARKTVGDIVLTATREIGARHPSHLVAVAYQWSWLPTLAEIRKIKIIVGPDAVVPGYRTITDAGTT